MGLPCTWTSCIQRYAFDHLDILNAIIITKPPLCHPIIKIDKKDMAQRSIFHFDRWKLHHLHRACFFLNILNSLSLRLCHRQGYHDRRVPTRIKHTELKVARAGKVGAAIMTKLLKAASKKQAAANRTAGYAIHTSLAFTLFNTRLGIPIDCFAKQKTRHTPPRYITISSKPDIVCANCATVFARVT